MKRFYRAAMSALAVAAILIGAVSCNEDVSLQGGIDTGFCLKMRRRTALQSGPARMSPW